MPKEKIRFTRLMVAGGTIKRLREGRRLTQARLAELLGVTDKAVSRWETGRGLPDLTLLEPLAKALGHPAAGHHRRPGGVDHVAAHRAHVEGRAQQVGGPVGVHHLLPAQKLGHARRCRVGPTPAASPDRPG